MVRWLRPSDEIAGGPPAAPRVANAGPAVLLVLLLLGAGLVLLSPEAGAKQKFMSGFAQAYPAAAGTQLDSCLLCHTDPVKPKEENLNNYGEDWEDEDFGDEDYLAPALVNRDSDGDGVTNGQEIQQLSLPGDPTSNTPPTTTTTVPGTPPNGQALYEARCASCHGPNGGDLVGTRLARSAFISITINGQGGMPAQTGLSDEEAGAIWDYVTGATPTTTTTTEPGATTTTTQPAGGATVWAQNCASCHGSNGGNVVPTTLSKSQLVSITTNGVGSMRGFPELGAAQISNVADYLLSLSVTTTTLPGETTTTTAPRSGAAVYAASCALCHGADGGNLRGHTLSLSQITSITANGVGTMAGYAGRLSTAEIDNVSQYIASLGAGAGVTTTTAPPDSPLSGSTLYMQHCSGCHGLHGEGGPGGPVTGTSLDRSQIISVTASGADGMPGYGSQLSSAEIAAIADHVMGLTGGADNTLAGGADNTLAGGGDQTDAGSVVPPELVEGHSLYGQFCAACHGVNGEGGLGGPIANLELSALEEIIRNGIGSMPGFADQLTDAEVEALVAYSAALAGGSTFNGPTTTTSADEQTLAAGDFFGRTVGNHEDEATGGTSVATVVAVLVGTLAVGGAAFWWWRAVRHLTD